MNEGEPAADGWGQGVADLVPVSPMEQVTGRLTAIRASVAEDGTGGVYGATEDVRCDMSEDVACDGDRHLSAKVAGEVADTSDTSSGQGARTRQGLG